MATNDEFASMMGDVARRLLGAPNSALSTANELRYGTRGSLSVNLESGTFYDHEAGVGGGVIDLVKREIHGDQEAAVEWLKQQNFLNGGNGGTDTGFIIGETYDYVDERGALLFQVLRLVPRDFRQRRPDGHGGWIWSLDDTRRVLYRLPQLIEAVAGGRTILIPEGEKDVNNVVRLGYAATCNPGGASKGKRSKWRPEYNKHFRGADIVLMPDNDEAGWKHVSAIGTALTGIAARIRVLMMPDGAKDVSAWIEVGGTREQLDKLIENAPAWMSPTMSADDDGKARATAEEKAIQEALLAELARMRPGVEKAQQKKRLAKQFDVRQAAIDEELRARWPNGGRIETAPLYGHWVVEPWPEVVDGDSLLRDIIRRIRRHVVISHEDALAVALWVMFAWVHDVAVHSPILAVVSAEPDSGKTTTLGVVAFLVPRAIATVEISEAALYRSIEIWHPCFVIDEFDTVLADDDAKPLRSVINSGHTRSHTVVRCNTDQTGDKTPRTFSTFGPKAIGMIGRRMPPATLSRCIFIEMRRKKANEPVERFQHIDDPDLGQLRSRLLRWSTDNEDALRGVEPPMPTELLNRRGDNWRVQLAIADLCGGDWGDQARATALRIEGKEDKDTIGVKALAAIRRVFKDRGNPDSMLSAAIVAELVADPEGPWAEYSRGKPLTQNKLAKLLRNFGLHSETVHVSDGVHGRGYKRIWLEEVWSRYLSDDTDTGQEGAF